MKITDMLVRALGSAIAFLPNLFAALVILAIGFLVAAVLGRLTRRVLKAIGLDRRERARELFRHEQSLIRLPITAGRIVFWVFGLITLGVAIDALRLTWLSAGVARVLAYLPSALAAAAIVAVGYLASNFVYQRIVRRETPSLFLATLARAAILVFAGFMAVQELGIATAIVTTAFTLGLGALAVAAAVAFGWGNRELAGRITLDWYERRGFHHRMHEPSQSEELLAHGEAPHPRH